MRGAIPALGRYHAVQTSMKCIASSASAWPFLTVRDGARASLPRGHYRRFPLPNPSHRGAEHPRRKFRAAEIKTFALGRLARGHLQHQIEDALAAFLYGLVPVENGAAVDVHVIFHAPEHRRVGRELDRRRRLAPEHAAASGGEADKVGAAGHLAGRRYRIVARGGRKSTRL